MSDDPHDAPSPPRLIDVFKSVGAAFIGIQSDANRRRDFSQGKLHHYVIAGAIATLAFVVVL
jgi:hypothetical protein